MNLITGVGRSAKSRILEALSADRWVAAHELCLVAISQNSICTRLSELAAAGLVEGRVREGKNFKEWSIATKKAAPVVNPERWL